LEAAFTILDADEGSLAEVADAIRRPARVNRSVIFSNSSAASDPNRPLILGRRMPNADIVGIEIDPVGFHESIFSLRFRISSLSSILNGSGAFRYNAI